MKYIFRVELKFEAEKVSKYRSGMVIWNFPRQKVAKEELFNTNKIVEWSRQIYEIGRKLEKRVQTVDLKRRIFFNSSTNLIFAPLKQ